MLFRDVCLVVQKATVSDVLKPYHAGAEVSVVLGLQV
jgi:hypothetical protein